MDICYCFDNEDFRTTDNLRGIHMNFVVHLFISKDKAICLLFDNLSMCILQLNSFLRANWSVLKHHVLVPTIGSWLAAPVELWMHAADC